MVEILDPFHRDIINKLNEAISDRVMKLTNGGAYAIPEDVKTTSEKYAAAVSFIEALQTAKQIVDDVAIRRHGTARAPRDNEDE